MIRNINRLREDILARSGVVRKFGADNLCEELGGTIKPSIDNFIQQRMVSNEYIFHFIVFLQKQYMLSNTCLPGFTGLLYVLAEFVTMLKIPKHVFLQTLLHFAATNAVMQWRLGTARRIQALNFSTVTGQTHLGTFSRT